MYPELRRRRHSVEYLIVESGAEVDYFVEPERGEPSLCQACPDMTAPKTRDRELGAIVEAVSETGVPRAVIVTLQDDATYELPGCRVRAVPIWRWLLDRSIEAGG